MKEIDEEKNINIKNMAQILEKNFEKQNGSIAKTISNLVSKFKENTKKILEGEHSDPHEFAQKIWWEFVRLFSEVNKSLETEDLTLKSATTRKDLKDFNVLFNFMRKFGKIKKVSLKQFESIMSSICNKNGSNMEQFADKIVAKLKTIIKKKDDSNKDNSNNEKAKMVTFSLAKNLIKLKGNKDSNAFDFLYKNWGNFAGEFDGKFNSYFNDKFESNPEWFGKLAKMVSEANGGQFNKNILNKTKTGESETIEAGQVSEGLLEDYKSGHIEDVLNFLRNAKKNCGYQESKAKADGEKEFAKKLFKWCDDVLEGYSKRRRAEIKEELDKNKKEKLKYIEDKEFKKKLEKEKDVYISEIQRHLHLAAKNFRKKDETGCYKHFRKAFDLLCLLAESEMTNNKSDKKGLKGWYTNAAKGVNKYNDEEIVKAIMKVTNYQNKGFLGFGKSRLTKIYKEILNLSNVFKNLIN